MENIEINWENTAKAVRAVRRAYGWNTARLGAETCRSSRSVENWEQGRRVPGPVVAMLKRLWEARPPLA